MDRADYLPVVNRFHEQISGPRDFPECLVQATAHVHNETGSPERYRHCYRCGKLVGVYATKPGSPYAWCVECF
jgi:hypothetical protein